MRSITRLVALAALAAVIAAVLVMLATARPAEAAFPDEAFPDGHDPIAFEKDGNIWVASKMHVANLTPDTANSREANPVVLPDGRRVTFLSDKDGDGFETYVANVFTGEAQRVTNQHGGRP